MFILLMSVNMLFRNSKTKLQCFSSKGWAIQCCPTLLLFLLPLRNLPLDLLDYLRQLFLALLYGLCIDISPHPLAVSASGVYEPRRKCLSSCAVIKHLLLQAELTQNHLMFHKTHQYQRMSGDLTFRHTHCTRERPNLSKQVSQVGRTGCIFVWIELRISKRSPGEFVLCRLVRTSEAHRVFP